MHRLQFMTVCLLVVCSDFLVFADSTNPHSPALVQISNLKTFDWLSVGISNVQYIKIDVDEKESDPQRKNLSELTTLVRRSVSLKSLWIPGIVLSDQLLAEIEKLKSLKTIVILDVLEMDRVLQVLRGCENLERVIFVQHMINLELPGKDVDWKPKFEVVDMFQDGEYFDSNGCPKSKFLKEQFGFNFSKKPSR